MRREDLDFYFDVVRDLSERGIPATVESIRRYVAPTGDEAQIVEAMAILVAARRLDKTTVFTWGADDEPREYEQYHLPHSQSQN
jgi:hypothetical protein